MDDRLDPPALDAEVTLPDGRTLSYAVWGDPEGSPVLLFHGSPGSRLFCPDAAASAAAGVRLVTVDRPGYGRSDVQRGRRVLDWPNDVRQLVDALGMHSFAVAAHSSGGSYALACALAMPDRVTAAALVSCTVPLDQVPEAAAALDADGRQLVELARHDPDRAAATIAAAAAWLVSDPDRFLALPRPEADALLLQNPATRAMFLATIREAVRPGLDGYASDEVLDRRPWGFQLAHVDVPVTLWHGDQDPYVARGQAEAMATRLRRSRIHFRADRGHGLIIADWTDILDDLTAAGRGPHAAAS
jgi:pimeloyl-ACP methyl ester carboxylesterase